jgi:HSP20 family molecular chaperone IbpA
MPSRRDVERLGDEVHELLEEVWRVPRFAGHRRGFRPPVDVFQTEELHELTIVVELAGIDPETVRIDATDRQLRIWGERKRPRGVGQVFHHAEIEYGPSSDTSRSRSPSTRPARTRATRAGCSRSSCRWPSDRQSP